MGKKLISYICDALQEKVTYNGKRNFVVEQKIAGNVKKVKFQVLMDTSSRYVWEPVHEVKTQYGLTVYG